MPNPSFYIMMFMCVIGLMLSIHAGRLSRQNQRQKEQLESALDCIKDQRETIHKQDEAIVGARRTLHNLLVATQESANVRQPDIR